MIYRILKRVIESGNYDQADLLNKLDVYLAFGRITQEQYEELMGAVHA